MGGRAVAFGHGGYSLLYSGGASPVLATTPGALFFSLPLVKSPPGASPTLGAGGRLFLLGADRILALAWERRSVGGGAERGGGGGADDDGEADLAPDGPAGSGNASGSEFRSSGGSGRASRRSSDADGREEEVDAGGEARRRAAAAAARRERERDREDRPGASGVRWRHLAPPAAYLAENWPLRLVCASGDGAFVAAAGTHGLAVYSAASQRWRLFADRRDEVAIQALALTWYLSEVVVVVHAQTAEQMLQAAGDRAAAQPHGLPPSSADRRPRPPARAHLVFFRRNRLSLQSVLCRVPVPAGRIPRFVDCNEQWLILFTTDAHFYQYRLTPVREGPDGRTLTQLRVELTHEVAMAGGPVADPVSLSLLPSDSRCVFLSATGDLAVAAPEDDHRAAPLARNVEQFWLSADAPAVSEPMLWAHGRAGLQMWYPFSASSPIGLMSREQSAEFDLEVYPLGVAAHLGLVVGGSMGVTSADDGSGAVRFHLQIRMHPFLHAVLADLLHSSRSNPTLAAAIAAQFAPVPHFAHSLELLLHETLDRDDRSRDLATVVDFLRPWPPFAKVVASCARKMDVRYWHRLFTCVGPPQPLFDAALEVADVETAASYLRILAYLDGVQAAKRAGLRLFSLALDDNDLELVSDLARFLDPPEVQPDESPDSDAAQAQEMLMARHARQLLGRLDLVGLLRFAAAVRRDPVRWFRRERDRACLVTDWATSLRVLHTQFGIPLPASLPPSSSRATTRRLPAHRDLRYLTTATTTAGATHLTLLLATLLLDLDVVEAALSREPMVVKVFLAALGEQGCFGYEQVRAVLGDRLERRGVLLDREG